MRRDFYEEYVRVEDLHWWFRGRSVILPALLREHLRPPVEILDVGSGGGVVAATMLQFGSVTVCDVDPRCEAAVRRRPGLSFQYGRAESVPFPDECFDLVTAFDVLEHIEDDRAALRELIRVVRPGGGIALCVPAYQWMWGPQDEISGHHRRYDRRLLRTMIEEAGLQIERLTAFNTALFVPVAVIRLVRRLIGSIGDRPRARAVRSDFSMTPPGALNDLLATVFSAERRVLGVLDFPFGISLFAFARRPLVGAKHARYVANNGAHDPF